MLEASRSQIALGVVCREHQGMKKKTSEILLTRSYQDNVGLSDLSKAAIKAYIYPRVDIETITRSKHNIEFNIFVDSCVLLSILFRVVSVYCSL